MRIFQIGALGFALMAPGLAMAGDINLFPWTTTPGASTDLFKMRSDGSFAGLETNACNVPGDPLLGGVNFSDSSFDPNDCAYGAPYVAPIYASTLFNIIGNPTVAQFAQQKNLDPKDPNTTTQFVADTDIQLNQTFVLKSLASMIDNEAMVKKVSFEVPQDRIEYVVRKILRVDNGNLNDAILQDYVQTKVMAALQAGDAAVAKLADVGIGSDVVDLVMGKAPANGKTPQEIFDAFKAQFDAAVESVIRAPSHAVAGVKAPAYADLTATLLARYDDLMNPTTELATLFDRLKAKIGDGPFMFGVTWNAATEAKGDPSLASYASSFADAWKPAIIAGQNPGAGAPDAFPASFDDFYKFIGKKLQPLQTAIVRQAVVKKWLFSFWRNMDLPNPFQVNNPKHISEIFNPLSSLMLTITTTERSSTYNEMKFEVAAQPQADFTIDEITLGNSTADVATNAPVDPCALKFNAAFEKPYGDEQQAVLKQLADPDLVPARFDQLVAGARAQVPQDAFASAAAALKADPACASFAVSKQTVVVHVDPATASTLSPDAKARVQFLGIFMQSEQLQKMMIPKRSRRDQQGNVHHYFFRSRKVTYANPDDPEVEASVKDVIVMRRLADRMKEAVAEVIEPRFRVKVKTDPFGYGGVDGFQLKGAAADPRKWLEQIFIVARMQTNPELVMSRRIIEHSTKTFERAYDVP